MTKKTKQKTLKQSVTNIEQFQLIEECVTQMRMITGMTSDGIIESMRLNFDVLGPYNTADKYDMLVNNSAEEFAMQWMAFYNEYSGKKHY